MSVPTSGQRDRSSMVHTSEYNDYSQIIYIRAVYLPYASVILLQVYSVRSVLKKENRQKDTVSRTCLGTVMGGMRASDPLTAGTPPSEIAIPPRRTRKSTAPHFNGTVCRKSAPMSAVCMISDSLYRLCFGIRGRECRQNTAGRALPQFSANV